MSTSIQHSLTFLFYFTDLLFITEDTDITSYHDDSIYVSAENVDEVIESLEQAAITFLNGLK